MKRFIVAAFAFLVLLSAPLAEPRIFKIGDAVEMSYASAWYPGEVVALAPRGQEGTYTVRDPQGADHDYEWRRLRLAGQDLKEPGNLTAESTFGTWGVGAAGQVDYGSGNAGGGAVNLLRDIT
jgi:hypothetical protein